MDPGIYFGLDEDAYHADGALGSTDLKRIAVDATDWQFERLHGEDKETDALIFGRALHCRVLEGEAAFRDKFCCAFDKAAVPEDALETVDDLKNYLRDCGIKATGNKADLIERAQLMPNCPPIADVIRSGYYELNSGKTALSGDQWRALHVAVQWMQADSLLKDIMVNGAFTKGAPEISVFYDLEGIRLKARFDYLLGHAIVDLKTFATMYQESPSYAIPRAIIRQRYDLQAAAYVKAWRAAKLLWNDGKVFGVEPWDGFLAKVFDREDPMWIWVFLKSNGAPQPFVRRLPIDGMVFGTALLTIEHAINTYREKIAEFGEAADWPPVNEADILDSESFPAWFQDR